MEKEIKSFISEQWVQGEGETLISIDPATGREIGAGKEASSQQCHEAMEAAQKAFSTWSQINREERIVCLENFSHQLEKHREELAEVISLEVGKPRWEALTEVQAMIGKVNISIEAYEQRCGEFSNDIGITRFKPHGVMVVLGPYNFPGHVPNGHIVPALLAGNTLVFKPSPLTPLVAQKTVALWKETGLPPGVLQLLQGGGEVGKELVSHVHMGGVLFTGSLETGLKLNQFFADKPGKILALEMGGNNPLFVDVDNIEDRDAAVLIAVQSAYSTTGQRCTCSRRLLVPHGKKGDQFIERLQQVVEKIRLGAYTENPEPFMGPVISAQAATQIIEMQSQLLQKGGKALLKCALLEEGTGLLSPGIIDVTEVVEKEDKEIFGPLLQIIRVKNVEEGIREANQTAYGLSAGVLSDSRQVYEKFYREVKAGLINWNRQLTGSSSKAPFGGVGLSGNHRPSGYFAADYCSYPVASIEKEKLTLPKELPQGLVIEG